MITRLRRFCTLAALPGILATFNVPAAQQVPSPLPDWSGEWELEGLTPHDGGLYQESADEIAARWNRPPYNNDVRQAAFIKPLHDASSRSGPPPGFLCTVGFPMLMLESPATFEALVTPHQTTLVFSTRDVRNIYTDGRAHTGDDEIWPTVWGDSIGHWEGQTLVVDTIAVSSPFQMLQRMQPEAGAGVGLPSTAGASPRIAALFSKQARYTERIRLLRPGLLEVQLTVHDPLALASDWQFTRRFRKIVGVNRMVFQECEGDTRHEIVDGVTLLKLDE